LRYEPFRALRRTGAGKTLRVNFASVRRWHLVVSPDNDKVAGGGDGNRGSELACRRIGVDDDLVCEGHRLGAGGSGDGNQARDRCARDP